jgi:Ca2+/H+ antiporter, TMEM165/GDT1 family
LSNRYKALAHEPFSRRNRLAHHENAGPEEGFDCKRYTSTNANTIGYETGIEDPAIYTSVMNYQAVISSFALVAISEMGDKTQLLAFSLAARFKKPVPIMAGILTATILNHGLASTIGQWIADRLPGNLMALILAATFIGFGIWTLKPDKIDETSSGPQLGAFVTTAFLFFLAEMGDKTQLATVALAARYHSVAAVTLGTTTGMMLTDGLAVFLGERLAGTASMKWIRWAAAGLFLLFGVVSLISVL